MARLNMMKTVGLILLLVIALTLPAVLPQTSQTTNGQISTPAPNDRSNV